MFRQPGSAEVTERYEALRFLSGYDETDAGEDFSTRYDVERTPTLLVLAPDGAVVLRRSGTLVQDVPGLLALLVEGERACLRYREEEARLRPQDDVEGQRRLARFFIDHYQHEAAMPLLRALLERAPRRREHLFLAWALERDGQDEARAAAYREMLKTYADDPDAMAWRLRLALHAVPEGEGLQAFLRNHPRRVRALERLLARTADPTDRLYVHGALALEYENVMWYPEAPETSQADMFRHHAELLKLRKIDLRKPTLFLLLGHALDWSHGQRTWNARLVRGWLKAAARIDRDEVTPTYRAELEGYTRRFEELLHEAERGGR